MSASEKMTETEYPESATFLVVGAGEVVGARLPAHLRRIVNVIRQAQRR